MSSYPNMSYCMIQNTVLAMQQVCSEADATGPDFLKNLSRSELRAFHELFTHCEDFMRVAEELQENEVY
jgi:hypothetical protein